MRAYNFGGSGSSPAILCHKTKLKVGMITYVQFFWGGACTPEIWKSQKVENSAQIRTTFEFDRKYLSNVSRYQKSGTYLIDIYFCGVQQKIGKLWSTNKKVTSVDAV